MSPDPKIQLPDYRKNRRGRDFCRRRKHFWLILRDLCQFCAQLSRFKKRNLPIATISCSCDQMTVIPSTFWEIFPKYRLFGPFLALFSRRKWHKWISGRSHEISNGSRFSLRLVWP